MKHYVTIVHIIEWMKVRHACLTVQNIERNLCQVAIVTCTLKHYIKMDLYKIMGQAWIRTSRNFFCLKELLNKSFLLLYRNSGINKGNS